MKNINNSLARSSGICLSLGTTRALSPQMLCGRNRHQLDARAANHEQKKPRTRIMKFNAWTLGLLSAGLVSLPAVTHAEEKPSSVLTALSATTLSGYVDTSAQWNFGTGNARLPDYKFGGGDKAKGKDSDCSIDFKYGMKRDFNKWLASLGAAAPVKTLTELRQWNVAHQRAGSIKYGQALLDVSDEMNVETDAARYRADREKDLRLSGTNGIDAAMKKYQLDALLFPGPNSASIAAKPGYPTVIVPFGLVPNAPPLPAQPFPEGFAAKPTPFGVGFTGMSCSEARLIELAYAFEQATKRRVPPPSAP
jgi:amidase